jgi:hypothetical protein
VYTKTTGDEKSLTLGTLDSLLEFFSTWNCKDEIKVT